MTLPAPTYDLVLLLDPQSEESARAKIVADARKAIEAQGEFLRHDEWGERALAYPIDHKTGAEYHLLQFHATPELLSTLNRTLRIIDEVIRFRVIKLAPGTPEAPDIPAAGVAGGIAGGAARRGEAEPAAAEPTEPIAEPAVEHPAEPIAEFELAAGEPA
jgi:small subunit ribosomal protein S6